MILQLLYHFASFTLSDDRNAFKSLDFQYPAVFLSGIGRFQTRTQVRLNSQATLAPGVQNDSGARAGGLVDRQTAEPLSYIDAARFFPVISGFDLCRFSRG